MLQAFRAKTTGLHLALREGNSGAKSGRKLFKVSKDSENLVVSNENIFLVGGCGFFVSDIISGGLRLPWSTSPGRKWLDNSISLKFLLETRLQSKSFDALYDLLG